MSISAIRITKMKFYLILMIAFVIQHNWSVSANVSLTPPSDSSFEAKSMLEAEPDTQYDSELLCRGEWKSPQNCNNYNCDYKATWEYIDDNDEIVFTISTKNRNKWTGIGFSENQAMPETDAVLGLVEERFNTLINILILLFLLEFINREVKKRKRNFFSKNN
jgi:hypothetical protein